jgi:uncharacterized protein (UPF0276 family)
VVETSELGVGVVWFGGLAPLIAAADDLIDFLEIEPATTSLPGEASGPRNPTDSASSGPDHRPRVVHGVSCPVGGSIAPSPSELANLAEAADRLQAPWVSEHLSIDRLPQANGEPAATGFFLPPAQTPATVELAAQRLRDLANITGRPVAFETGVNYFAAQPDQMLDGEFFAAVAEEADCLILLDLHNLWCNEHNGRQSIAAVIDSLPLERVVEVHLAGGQRRDRFLLDAHSALVDPALIEVAAGVIGRLPALRALTFELVPDYVRPAGIDAASYRRQLEQLQRLWALRGSASRSIGASNRHVTTRSSELRPEQWEAAVGAALRGEPGLVGSDPGTELYRHLITAVRSGAIVTSLPLSFRYLVASLGIERAEVELARYQSAVPASAWAYDEAIDFARYARSQLPLPHLDEVIHFELAAYEAELTGTEQTTTFTCDPHPLLDALRKGRHPPTNQTPGSYEVSVRP